MKPSRRNLLALVLVAAVPGTHTHATAQAQFVPLGDLPGGSFSSRAKGASADGAVVVGLASGATSEAFRWRAAPGMIGLGALPGGNASSDATAASSDGAVVVGSSDTANGCEAFRWTAATGMVGLGDLPGGFDHSLALDVSADGAVVVGNSSSTAGNEAFLWTAAGGMVGLGDLPGGAFFSSAQGVSADGLVVVGASTGTSTEVAFRWTQTGGMIGLGFLPGDNRSIATAASADGSVVVGSSRSPTNVWESFRWTNGAGLIGIGSDTQAHDVSGDGQAIVGRAFTVPGNEAYLWTNALGMLDLRTHLIAQGATGLAGWQLREALAISEDGNAIVGFGTNPSGQTEAWVAYLSPPAPTTIGSSYCGPATPNSSGQPAVLTASGSDAVLDGDVTLTASQLPPGQFGYFLAGRTQGFFNPPGSQGFICLSGNIGRYNQIANIIQGPTGSIALDLGAIPVNPPAAVQAGETWNFQCWFRDNNPSLTSNFTDGVSVVFM